MRARIRNLWAGLAALWLLLAPRHRRLWVEMRGYVRALPAALAGPLPAALAAQTPAQADLDLREADLRRLADAAALFERRSPLGLCLRRSLARYHYLRRAGVPLTLNFGARFTGRRPDRDVTGHAWVTLAGRPYCEDGENYSGFAVMLQYPD
ncbi:MAG: lasso peptide biosynthesis B2 protein [Anaerolineales bacterium]|nr:lasso peptide biosynthesis B2 protein [Anaerolineales bacterium]